MLQYKARGGERDSESAVIVRKITLLMDGLRQTPGITAALVPNIFVL